MKKPISLYDLFIEHLEEIRAGEELLLVELPLLLQRARQSDLVPPVNAYDRRTRRRIERIDHVFDLLELSPEKTECEIMESLLQSGRKKMTRTDSHVLRDLELAFTLQSISHFKISTYNTLASIADWMEMDEVAPLLRTTLEEEKENDRLISDMVKKILNKKAKLPDHDSGVSTLRY